MISQRNTLASFTSQSTTDGSFSNKIKERSIEDVYMWSMFMFQAPPALQDADEKSSASIEIFDKSKELDTMSFMITNTTSLDEQIAKMSKLLETLVDLVKEKDNQIAYLMSEVDGLIKKGPIATKEF